MWRAGSPDPERNGEAGFTLLETVCVLAVIALLAAVALPRLPRGTSGPQLEGYAVAVASLLGADRLAAIRSGRRVASALDSSAGTVRSGATPRLVSLPADVRLGAVLAAHCSGRAGSPTVDFFPNGMSCGGVVNLEGAGRSIDIRVNWLTGGIELAAAGPR